MPSILIVDDNPQVRRVIRSFLEGRRNFRAVEAGDGLEAIEKAKEIRPDVVILDLSMPRMNGLDAARALRATIGQVPIILFTIYAETVAPSQLQQAGISAVISKADITGLVRHVESVLPPA